MEERSAVAAVGAHVELRSAKEQAVSVEIVDPDGKRPLSLRESTTAQSFQVDRAGFFEVRRANGRHEMVAVNADRRESDLSVIPAETVQLWTATGGAAGNTAAAKPETPAGFQEEPAKKPWSFWWYFLLLAGLATVGESIFASRYLGVQRE
jgi:hypothetical protein